MARSLERYVKFFALREIFWNFLRAEGGIRYFCAA